MYVGDVAARISTHALLAEGDEHVLRHAAGHVRISTHALLAEGDKRLLDSPLSYVISTHALLAEGDPSAHAPR